MRRKFILKNITPGASFKLCASFEGVESNTVRIGSAVGLELTLQGDSCVLPLHCVIHNTDSGFIVYNTSGCENLRLNGVKVETYKSLSDGDGLQIGSYVYLFKEELIPDSYNRGRMTYEEGGLAKVYDMLKIILRRKGLMRD